MGLIVKVKVSHYVCIHTDEEDVDLAFDNAEAIAREEAESDGLKDVEVEDMEIIGSTESVNEDEDSIYEERRAMQIGCVA